MGELGGKNWLDWFCTHELSVRYTILCYTRKNGQVVTDLQTSCDKVVVKLISGCVRTACSHKVVVTSLEQVVITLLQC